MQVLVSFDALLASAVDAQTMGEPSAVGVQSVLVSAESGPEAKGPSRHAFFSEAGATVKSTVALRADVPTLVSDIE
jgi:hypothetical protein